MTHWHIWMTEEQKKVRDGFAARANTIHFSESDGTSKTLSPLCRHCRKVPATTYRMAGKQRIPMCSVCAGKRKEAIEKVRKVRKRK